MCIQAVELFGMVVIFTNLVTIFVGFCQISEAFAQNIKYNLSNLSLDVKSTAKQMGPQKHTQLKIRLCNIIQFHAEAKGFVLFFS